MNAHRRQLWAANPEKFRARERKRYPQRRDSKLTYERRAIRFGTKRVYLNDNPRTGICSECGYKGLTHMHHDEYHADNPLAQTRELCNHCHGKTIKQPRDSLSGRFIPHQ